MSDTHTEAPSVYSPSPEFAEQANATEELYREAEQDRLAFWAKQADRLSWDTPFTEVLDWSEAPFAKWFVGGKLNVAYNCVDRHVEAGNGDRVAILWEGDPVGDSRDVDLRRVAGRGVQGRQRADRPRLGRRRSGRHLHADGPRGDRRDAGLRPSRCHAFRGVRRFLRVRAEGPHRGRRGQTGDHHRRPVPPRQGGVVEGSRRRGGRRSAKQSGRARAGGAAHRHRHPVDRGPRPVVARDRRRGVAPSTPRRRSTPSIRCSCSTRRAPRASPRASCTPPAAT